MSKPKRKPKRRKKAFAAHIWKTDEFIFVGWGAFKFPITYVTIKDFR